MSLEKLCFPLNSPYLEIVFTDYVGIFHDALWHKKAFPNQNKTLPTTIFKTAVLKLVFSSLKVCSRTTEMNNLYLNCWWITKSNMELLNMWCWKLSMQTRTATSPRFWKLSALKRQIFEVESPVLIKYNRVIELKHSKQLAPKEACEILLC